ncbi:MAG: class I SAM-dependent DNA methyltransferase [Candidatus Aenigmatarchaeota archaeon]
MKDIYKDFAKFYENLEFGKFDEYAIPYIFQQLKKLKYKPKKVLDLACGNGIASVLLAKKGMKVYGLDISREMLKIAKLRAKKANVRITFIHAYMRNFTLPEKVDLVVSLYDSLNYLLKLEDLEKTFKNVFNVLVPGGIFIFDMNTRETLKRWDNWVYFNEKYNIVMKGSFNSQANIAKLLIVMFIKKRKNLYKKVTEVHVEKAYKKSEIRKCLRKVGFRKIHFSEFPPIRRYSLPGRLLCIAIKK